MKSPILKIKVTSYSLAEQAICHVPENPIKIFINFMITTKLCTLYRVQGVYHAFFG